MQPDLEAGGACACMNNPAKASRATVKLNSLNVRDPPSVDTNLLAQQEEVERMVMCLEREKLYWEKLREIGFNITEILPGEGVDLQAAVCSQSLAVHAAVVFSVAPALRVSKLGSKCLFEDLFSC
jgi:hypothetical protein